ncbi:hypothetical protein M404DRAFT_372720 [Pisolithus tinctorius Marx 270]|uniref:Uncharacterized protein n=1 Tax=Pisolithus tinctorius Marx 270 TaxID=870435 RepID=A0A0C3JAM6_PISTI|nr:hypothetical protein M404DRAFT_372720 [Pisolithus tinctorius Marx 270]
MRSKYHLVIVSKSLDCDQCLRTQRSSHTPDTPFLPYHTSPHTRRWPRYTTPLVPSLHVHAKLLLMGRSDLLPRFPCEQWKHARRRGDCDYDFR